MYITTFYSYKGGVGRTMALSNVAYLLARDGKRVLIVDFDLEAPGLATYAPFRCAKSRSGIVEYVSEFIATNVAPSVDEYIVPCEIGEHTVWLMPAGDFTCDSYNQRLHAINWKELYAERSGFLLIEDMKQQWANFEDGAGFDYVFIDSRTGHTDVGGICTRQLPDSVVVMFVPTPQNIDGLKPIVESIRKERAPVRKKKIRLHFCPSNVPDLDDEESILKRLIDSAQQELDYTDNAGLIQHYQSLDLLQQPVYAASHPRSRLVRQYDELKTSIVSGNLGDRDGALTALRQMGAVYRQSGTSLDRDTLTNITIDASFIRNTYPNDPEIALGLAGLANAMVRPEEELSALNTVIEFGEEVRFALIRRAITRTTLDDRSGAIEDLRAVLLSGNTTLVEARSSIELLTVFDPDNWRATAEESILRPDVDGMVKSSLLELLLSSHSYADRVAELCREAIVRGGKDAEVINTMLILALISASRFAEALEVMGASDDREAIAKSSRINDVFNYAIAEWAQTGTTPHDLFQRVIVLAGEMKTSGPNLLQCVALSKGALGFLEEALEDLSAAESRTEHGSATFSCWRYLSVSGEEMISDLQQMRSLIEDGRTPVPPWHEWQANQ